MQFGDEIFVASFYSLNEVRKLPILILYLSLLMDSQKSNTSKYKFSTHVFHNIF